MLVPVLATETERDLWLQPAVGLQLSGALEWELVVAPEVVLHLALELVLQLQDKKLSSTGQSYPLSTSHLAVLAEASLVTKEGSLNGFTQDRSTLGGISTLLFNRKKQLKSKAMETAKDEAKP
ncbi:hypothetical protein CB1_002658002 [Camelus ferus]|nr:hypothetical protein CB1_002658002 [Camelus ferus]